MLELVRKTVLAVFAMLLLLQPTAHAFSPHSSITATARCTDSSSHELKYSSPPRADPFSTRTRGARVISSSTSPSTTRSVVTALNYSNDFMDESEKRGGVIFAITLLLCVWSFSIPVELRRDHWCFTDKCSENRSRCNDCVTFSEWYGKVNEYYANGGGINFDFSIEEK